MALPAQQPNELEAAIDRQYQRVCSALTKEEREAAWIEFARLVNSRSAERVAEMEVERGLR